jgi:hypothetical protein
MKRDQTRTHDSADTQGQAKNSTNTPFVASRILAGIRADKQRDICPVIRPSHAYAQWLSDELQKTNLQAYTPLRGQHIASKK